MSLLEIADLKVEYDIGGGATVRALDGVSLDVNRGESVGLVGESGCGKTTLGNVILGLEEPASGRVVFDDTEVLGMKGAALKRFRRRVQMVFQDPFGSLNARMTVGSALEEVLKVHRVGNRKERRARVTETLNMVGLDPAYAARYPHEFSGGQRQRIGIARALILQPELVIADEPVSALDVSVQVQILNLMRDLQEKMSLSYLFVAHDLAVVRYMCSRVYVMYLGNIMESSDSGSIFSNPAHPYTEALLSAIPDVEKGLQRRKATKDGSADPESQRIILRGEVPSAVERIRGCPFHSRCIYAEDVCRAHKPSLKKMDSGRFSACHFAGEFRNRQPSARAV